MALRVEVRYPAGAVHQVTLPGRVAILGRDPTCDLVLNDAKCSRRHAVIEEDPAGPVIRDTGSANGVFVNGRKVARAVLKAGDEIQLGELKLKLLPEATDSTLIVEAGAWPSVSPVSPVAPTIGDALSASEVAAEIARLESAGDLTPPGPSPPMTPADIPPPAASPPVPAGAAKPRRREVSGEIVLQPSKASAAPAGEAGGKRRLPVPLLVGAAVLAFVLAAVVVVISLVFVPRMLRSFGSEREAAAQLRAMAAAQEAFRMVCNSGYGDLEALLNPSSVFPDYPKRGPAFLKDPVFRQPVRLGYRFHLAVDQPVPPTPSCPFRSYRRYRYSAMPVSGRGRTLVVSNDGVVQTLAPAVR